MRSLKLLFVILSLSVILLFLALVTWGQAHANTVGIGFSRSIDGEVSVGAQGDYESDKFDIEYTYQGIDFHDAKVDIAYRQSLGFLGLDVTVFQENDWSGYSLTNLNRTNDLGLAIILPIKDLDIEISVFGRNGKNGVAPKSKYDPDTGEKIETIPGLTPVDGTHPNVSFATGFDVSNFEIEAKALTNFADDPTPQWLLDASTTGEIWLVNWQLSGLYTGQRHAGEYQHEFSTLLTFGIKF